MGQFRGVPRAMVGLMGAVMMALGAVAIVGAVFMFTAGLFGVEITWLQGSAVALCLKLAGSLAFGSVPRKAGA
jgi:hypothetical protein